MTQLPHCTLYIPFYISCVHVVHRHGNIYSPCHKTYAMCNGYSHCAIGHAISTPSLQTTMLASIYSIKPYNSCWHCLIAFISPIPSPDLQYSHTSCNHSRISWAILYVCLFDLVLHINAALFMQVKLAF